MRNVNRFHFSENKTREIVMSVTRNMSGVAAHNAEQNQQIRKSLAEALQILMSQKEYNSISISELCKKAGVSRTAFYNNFSTLSDVFEEVARTFITEINEKITPLQAHNSLEWYENFFRLVEQNSQSYLTIRKAGFQGKYLEITNDIILAHDWLTEKEKWKRLAFNGAVQNMAFRWMAGGMKERTEQIAKWAWEALELR